MSNPLGPGTRNISTNVSNELYAAMYQLASSSGVKIGEFMRALMHFAEERQVRVRENPEDKAKWFEAVKQSVHPLPSVRLELILPDEFHQTSMDSVTESEPEHYRKVVPRQRTRHFVPEPEQGK